MLPSSVRIAFCALLGSLFWCTNHSSLNAFFVQYYAHRIKTIYSTLPKTFLRPLLFAAAKMVRLLMSSLGCSGYMSLCFIGPTSGTMPGVLCMNFHNRTAYVKVWTSLKINTAATHRPRVKELFKGETSLSFYPGLLDDNVFTSTSNYSSTVIILMCWEKQMYVLPAIIEIVSGDTLSHKYAPLVHPKTDPHIESKTARRSSAAATRCKETMLFYKQWPSGITELGPTLHLLVY